MNLSITPRINNNINQNKQTFKADLRIERRWGGDLGEKVMAKLRQEYETFGTKEDKIFAKIDEMSSDTGIGEDDCPSTRRELPIAISSLIDGNLKSPENFRLSEFAKPENFFIEYLKDLKKRYPHKVNQTQIKGE